MSDAASVDQETAKAEGLSSQMTLCYWGWTVAFTLACGFALMGQRWSLHLGSLLLVVGNFFSISMPMQNKAGDLTPNPAWTEPLTARKLMQIVVGLAPFVGLFVALSHWIPDSPQAEDRAIRFISHPLVVVPFWAWIMRLMFRRWRQASKGREEVKGVTEK